MALVEMRLLFIFKRKEDAYENLRNSKAQYP